MNRWRFLILMCLVLAVAVVFWGVDEGRAQLVTPDYFGVPNYANSPIPQINPSGAVVPGTGMRKFVNTLPGLCAVSGATPILNQCIPLATADTGNYPSFQGPPADFYRIGVQEYTLQMHSDLPPTKLRGYVQIDSSGNPIYDPATPGKQQYLGPLILAVRNKPVRVLFNNKITTNLNIPIDPTYMGAGMVNDGTNSMMASQKRATLHLHGGNTPWISDGTTMQWITPAGGDGQPNAKGFRKGFSFMNVPDMLSLVPDTLDDGLGTFYWPNQQSGRLLFFHDHAYGITRLNVYGGEAAGYLLVDPAQENALAAATVPGTIGTTPDLAHLIPLVIQDKTFVPDPAQLAATDPTWDTTAYGGKGSLWFPHVYMPNQNPYDESGANPLGRWDWGPWFWPPQPVAFPAVPCTSIAFPGVQLTCPSTPNPSGTPEAFMDTPVVNGTAYPKLVVDPRAYRFHILSVGNDRALNLGLYVADPLTISITAGGSGYTSPPTVTITGGGGTYISATATVNNGIVDDITVTGATGYTSVPTVVITGGGGSGAAAIASVNTEVKMVPAVPANARPLVLGGTVSSLTLTNNGSGFTSTPTVTITGGGGSGATATATLGGKPVASIAVTVSGSGYTSPPTVTITGGGGSGATATATVFFGWLWSISVTNGGSGYTSPPAVTISGGGGTGGTATATLSTLGGSVAALSLTSGGTGYTSPPTVTITGGGGTGATATATLSLGGLPSLPDCTTSNQMSGGGLILAQDTNGNPINTPTGLPAGCWPKYDSTFFGPLSWPTDSRDGGVPDPTTAGPPIIQIGTEGGLLPKPAVIPSTPISYDYNKRSITVLNVLNHGLFLGPAERADVIIDFSAFAGKTLILYNDAPAPVPASDPRVDYYTDNPDNTPTGGAPSTLAGYGPNTRTIMQIVVNNTTPNTSFSLASLTTALPTIFASTQDPIIVPETAYPPSNGGAVTNTYVRIQDNSISLFSGGPVGGLTLMNVGSGYASAPTVTITGGGGSGATATATLSTTGSVVGLTVTSGGSGFTSTPTVTFTGGGGSGAAATATLVGQPVASIGVTNGGSGYTSPPAVTITGGGGSGATATATLTGPIGVASLTLTSGGTGFTSTPTVTITGGGGSGATATATLGGKPVASIAVTVSGSGYTSPPTVNITGGGGSGATATATVFFGWLWSISVTNGGSGYTSPPAVTISGGGGTGGTATATLSTLGGSVGALSLTSGGTGYTSPPTVTITGGGGSGAAATATLGGQPVASIAVTNGGSGYTSPPTVTIAGGGGSGATATATLPAPTGVASIGVTNGGSGYTSPPTVTFTGGGGSGAAATATLPASGPVGSLTLTSGGTGFTSTPTVTITGGGGSGATATATLGGKPVASIAVTVSGSGYTSPPTVTITGGGGSGATATATVFFGWLWSISVTNGGSGYTSPPAVTISGGGGTGGTATATLSTLGGSVAALSLTSGGTGYTSAPTVTITGGGGSGAAATATLGSRPVASISVTNGGSGYTSPPTVNITGGGGSGATATATLTGPIGVASLTLTNGGTGYTSPPTVTIAGGGGTGATATATIGMSVASLTLTSGGTGYTSPPTVTIAGGGGSGALAVATGSLTQLLPKAIQELFTLDYGRMNALLGVEIPFTNNLTQTTIPYGYVDPPTEVFKDGDTQLWKITHNGVDTHFIHFHLFTVQVINRVGWDGAIKPPDPNELSFKDTVRMNPLEDIIVALKAMKQTLPWSLPNSIRPMDVTMPVGTTNATGGTFLNVDPTNQPAAVTNSLVNYGWEYVWHCHILGHEENDMMRAMAMSVAPNAPSNLVAAGLIGPVRVSLTWNDNSINETGFTIQRAINAAGPWTTLTTVPANTVTYTDMTVVGGTTYYYQVIANNMVGYTQTYSPPAIGYPQVSADSAPAGSNPVTP